MDETRQQYRIVSLHERFHIVRFLIIALTFGANASVMVPPSRSQDLPMVYTNFAHYLTDRTWVRDVEIDLSKNRYRPHNYPADRFAGFTTWRASLQPGGFYFQCVSNSPFDPMLTYGESSTSFWQTSSKGISVAPKRPEEGGSEKNGRQIMCLSFKRIISDVLNLGIEGLDNQNVIWTTTNEFKSPLLDWIGKPTGGEIRVSVESAWRGLPTRLRCVTRTSTGQGTTVISCEYDRPSLPPARVICKKVTPADKELISTNVIRTISFGLRSESLDGFKPSDLLPAGFVPKVNMVASNGARYLVLANGRRELVDETPTRAFPVDTPVRNHARLAYILFTLTSLVLPVVFWAIWSRKRKP